MVDYLEAHYLDHGDAELMREMAAAIPRRDTLLHLDFHEGNVKLYDQNEYADRVADTTVNYFYAPYVLSKCTGFLASTLCNGVNIVRGFNGGRFECDDIVREMIIRGARTR